jgi:long-subunit acyl-CoA synthetase (AMP-forming)
VRDEIVYALADCDPVVLVADELARRPGSAGRPMPTVEVGEGEIHIRSPLQMLGYWRRPAETDAAFAPGHWLRTGDVGRLRDGHLYIDSRKRDLILRGGENVYPIEIEPRLEAHPSVAAAVVVGVADAELGHAVKAIIVPAEGDAPGIETLCAWVADTLA